MVIDKIDSESERIYTIQLRIIHPYIAADEITDALNMDYSVSWSAGEARKTPSGTLLGGLRKDTYWSKTKKIRGMRVFSHEIAEVVSILDSNANFVKTLCASGGNVMIVLGLSGREVVGDVIEYSLMKRMVDLEVSLGVELFPAMR